MTASERAAKDLQEAQDKALDVISNAAQKAAHAITSAAADALKVTSAKGADDHDLLIEMRTQLKRLSEDIGELKNGTSKRIEDLECDKANKKEFDALAKEVYVTKEERIRKLENKTANYAITFGLYTLFLGGLIALVVSNILM